MVGTNNLVFLEIIEWLDDTGREMVHRIPESGSADIKLGAQLIVRESQAAVMFYGGKAYDAFGPGRHTLTTANIPVLTRALSLPWGFTSPLRAEVYMVNMKVFPNLKWGTRDPVAFKDSELGLIRLRAFGIFSLRVVQPVLFVNSLVGTQGIYRMDEVAEYLNLVIVSRFNDFMGEKLDSLFSLPGKYDGLAEDLKLRLAEDFSHFGLGLNQLYINSITPPPEVQKAIDDKSRLSIFDDLNRLLKMKTAMAIEKASESQGEAGAGMGLGVGMMMPAMFHDLLKKPDGPDGPNGLTSSCPGCHQTVPETARFCPYCGHHMLVFSQCAHCGENLAPQAKFCSRCGHSAGQKPNPRKCSQCGAENMPNSTFCNQCGERIL